MNAPIKDEIMSDEYLLLGLLVTVELNPVRIPGMVKLMEVFSIYADDRDVSFEEGH